MNKKVQRRQARVRHARREEILQAGRQWSLEPGPESEAGKSRAAAERAAQGPEARRKRELR